LIYTAVTHSPAFAHTVLVINYDEWGGFFDHVPPPTAPIPPADAALGSDGRLGFRTPLLVVSPWSQAGVVAHEPMDHTSVLRMIEWRWNLEPLTVRDANANNLADVLQFGGIRNHVPSFAVPAGPFGSPCTGGIDPGAPDFASLARLASLLGWPIGSVSPATVADLLAQVGARAP
jgi:phospholipase C